MSVESDLFEQLMRLYHHLLVELEHKSTILERMNQPANNNQSICKVVISQDSQTSTILMPNYNYTTAIETLPFNHQIQQPQATSHDNKHYGNMSHFHDDKYSNNSQPHSETWQSLPNNPHEHHEHQPKPSSSPQILSETKYTKQIANVKHASDLEFIQISANSIIENHMNPLKRKRGRPKKESNKKR